MTTWYPDPEQELVAKKRYHLLARLKTCQEYSDKERGHMEADAALLAFIDAPDIAAAFLAIERWYA